VIQKKEAELKELQQLTSQLQGQKTDAEKELSRLKGTYEGFVSDLKGRT
jgi:hypothetical protein